MITSDYLQFCQTDTQAGYVRAVLKCGSNQSAAKSLGVDRRTVDKCIKRVKRNAAKQGYAPEHDLTHTIPPTHQLKGASTLYDEEGKVKLQWVKSALSDPIKGIEEAALALAADIPPCATIKAPKKQNSDLINVIPMGDPHVGLYCWQAETGNDFDCDIAEKLMCDAIDYLVTNSPPADHCLIINLGDFYHADTAAGVTLRSGHKLDVDTRWSRVLEIGVRAFKQSIYRALEKHKTVTVINAIGNHDDHSSVFLNIVLREMFRNNKRVQFLDNHKIFQYHRFGKCLFGVTHGHTIKPLDLEGIMARDCNAEWSDTEHRKWFVGHYHSQRKHDARNCEIEYYRTLAAGDAWSVASGYRSYRDMRCETYHKDYGYTGMIRFDPIMVQ